MGIHRNISLPLGTLFRAMKKLKDSRTLWRDVPNKAETFYIPILDAFQRELSRICETRKDAVQKIVRYVLGVHDYYRVVKTNGKLIVEAFNIYGTLKWGGLLPLPTTLIKIYRKEGTKTTLLVIFDKGWQISFRIHNARSQVESSLKFDIQLIGVPHSIAKHEIDYSI